SNPFRPDLPSQSLSILRVELSGFERDTRRQRTQGLSRSFYLAPPSVQTSHASVTQVPERDASDALLPRRLCRAGGPVFCFYGSDPDLLAARDHSGQQLRAVEAAGHSWTNSQEANAGDPGEKAAASWRPGRQSR